MPSASTCRAGRRAVGQLARSTTQSPSELVSASRSPNTRRRARTARSHVAGSGRHLEHSARPHVEVGASQLLRRTGRGSRQRRGRAARGRGGGRRRSGAQAGSDQARMARRGKLVAGLERPGEALGSMPSRRRVVRTDRPRPRRGSCPSTRGEPMAVRVLGGRGSQERHERVGSWLDAPRPLVTATRRAQRLPDDMPLPRPMCGQLEQVPAGIREVERRAHPLRSVTGRPALRIGRSGDTAGPRRSCRAADSRPPSHRRAGISRFSASSRRSTYVDGSPGIAGLPC